MGKLEGFFDKVADAVSVGADKVGEFAKEHEIDEKLDNAAHTIENGAKSAWGSIKSTFESKDDNESK